MPIDSGKQHQGKHTEEHESMKDSTCLNGTVTEESLEQERELDCQIITTQICDEIHILDYKLEKVI